MNSGPDEWALPHPGSPIRVSPDRCLLAAPRGLSQLAAPFIASQRQGIHRSPLVAYHELRVCRKISPGYTRESPYSVVKDLREPGSRDIRLRLRLVEMTGFEPATPCLQSR